MTLRELRSAIFYGVLFGVALSVFFLLFSSEIPRRAWAITGPVYCDQNQIYDASDNGAIQVIGSPSGSGRIFICAYTVFTGVTATNVGLVYGTGVNCANGQTSITPLWQLGANGGVAENLATWAGMLIPNPNNVCVKSNAGNPHQARISYTVQ